MPELAFSPGAPTQEAVTPKPSLKEAWNISGQIAESGPKQEGFLSKALKATREKIREVNKGIKILKSPEARAFMTNYMSERARDANEAMDRWTGEKFEQFNQTREAAILATRNNVNRIGDNARNTAMEMWGAAKVMGNDLNENMIQPMAVDAVNAAKSVGATGRAIGENAAISIGNTLNTGIEAGKKAAEMGINTAKFFGSIAKEMPNEAKRWGESATRYYTKADRAVETQIKAGGRDILATFFGGAAGLKEKFSDIKLSIAEKLIRSAEANHEIAIKRRSSAEACKYISKQLRTLGPDVAGPIQFPARNSGDQSSAVPVAA